jgi:predicted N-acetyltransferase YhbS
VSEFSFEPESPAHDPQIESINAEAFGPGRFTRAAYRIREQGPHERQLSFVAMRDSSVVGSVRLTRILIGERPSLLLGPLAVRPDQKKKGVGRRLVAIAVEAAEAAGAGSVLLVGDAPYYTPLGFEITVVGAIKLPWPVEPSRLLIACLNGSQAAEYSGLVVHADCKNQSGSV